MNSSDVALLIGLVPTGIGMTSSVLVLSNRIGRFQQSIIDLNNRLERLENIIYSAYSPRIPLDDRQSGE